MTYTPRYPPLKHQAAYLRDHALDPAWGLFWQQGTGKTKALIDNACELWNAGLINAVLVVAPNGAHYNWARQELPKHWPEDMPPTRPFLWDTQRASGVGFQREWTNFLKALQFDNLTHSRDAVPILMMSYEGITITDAGKQASWHYMLTAQKRVLYIADESQRIKTPQMAGKNKVERTAVMTKSAQHASHRRIASGTPGDTPFDVYSQVRLLDPDFWKRELDIDDFTSFRYYFARFKKGYGQGGRTYPIFDTYQRLDKLAEALSKISTRVLKSDVLDLPTKVFKRHLHPLNAAQRAAYDQLRQEAIADLREGVVTATSVLVRRLRLDQVTSGFIGGIIDDNGDIVGERPLGASNPRTVLCRELMTDLTGPIVAWGHFQSDVQQLRAASITAGRRTAIFDGSRPGDSLEPWHAGQVDTLVANLSSGLTESHTLTEAQDMIYFSRSPKLITRQQSEDRIHRMGSTGATYHDLLADHTHDVRGLTLLQAKAKDMAVVLGDDPEEVERWLEPDAAPPDTESPSALLAYLLDAED